MLLHEFIEKLRQHDQMAVVYLADWDQEWAPPNSIITDEIHAGITNGTKWVVIGSNIQNPKDLN